MKRCPECSRDYYDDSLLFCLDDGAQLLEGPARSKPSAAVGGAFEESETAILHASAQPGEARTRAQIGVVDRPKGFDKRLLVAPVVAVIIAAGIYAAYRYFSANRSETINSVAVLPFENRSNDPEADYLSDGLAESLIYRLTQLPNLKVSPTSSVMQYKGKGGNLATIASELGVRAVMTGKLVQRGDTLTISVELIDVPNNKLLWGEQYDRKMSDLLATQREIAATIAQKLQLKLVGNEKGVAKKYTDSNEAYELYLKGRFHFARRSRIDLQRSVELLREAVKLDPNFALAYVGIAESYATMTSFPYMAPTEAYPLANAAITKALELDPDLGEAHTVAGMLAASYEWDYAKAEREFKRGIELNPNVATTHFRYGWTFLSPVGRHDEAIAEMQRAMEIEPLSVQQGSNYAAVLLYARRFDEALDQARKTYALDPSQIGAQNWLCHPLNAKGLYDEAILIGERAAVSQLNEVTSFNACLGIAYAKLGQREKSLAIMNRIQELGKTRYVSRYWTALHYAALGDKEAAFAELEKSFQNRDFFLNRMKVDHYLDPLRDDPRFDALVKRLNLPQ